MKSFASDNYSGIHPEIFETIQRATIQHEISYGDDSFTKEAQYIFEKKMAKSLFYMPLTALVQMLSA